MPQKELPSAELDDSGRDYHRLVIRAALRETEMWIGDDHGHPVLRARGVLDTSLMRGEYTVEFGLGSTTYPISLSAPMELTESQLRAGPTCPRPEFRFYE